MPDQRTEAVSPVIGVILMVAITVAIATVVYFIASTYSDAPSEPPPSLTYTFQPDTTDGVGGQFFINSWEGKADATWGSVDFVHNAAPGFCPGGTPPTGTITAGDVLDCDDAVNGDSFVAYYGADQRIILQYEFGA